METNAYVQLDIFFEVWFIFWLTGFSFFLSSLFFHHHTLPLKRIYGVLDCLNFFFWLFEFLRFEKNPVNCLYIYILYIFTHFLFLLDLSLTFHLLTFSPEISVAYWPRREPRIFLYLISTHLSSFIFLIISFFFYYGFNYFFFYLFNIFTSRTL